MDAILILCHGLIDQASARDTVPDATACRGGDEISPRRPGAARPSVEMTMDGLWGTGAVSSQGVATEPGPDL